MIEKVSKMKKSEEILINEEEKQARRYEQTELICREYNARKKKSIFQ